MLGIYILQVSVTGCAQINNSLGNFAAPGPSHRGFPKETQLIEIYHTKPNHMNIFCLKNICQLCSRPRPSHIMTKTLCFFRYLDVGSSQKLRLDHYKLLHTQLPFKFCDRPFFAMNLVKYHYNAVQKSYFLYLNVLEC